MARLLHREINPFDSSKFSTLNLGSHLHEHCTKNQLYLYFLTDNANFSCTGVYFFQAALFFRSIVTLAPQSHIPFFFYAHCELNLYYAFQLLLYRLEI